jgi:ATP-dependent Clp protease adaptor protein ClpS
MSSKEKIKASPDFNEFTNALEERNLILHNDEVHSFDYVIDALIEICEHDTIQAEQCTFIVHYNGKCDVKKGMFDYLHPMKDGLVERGLNATID